MHNPQITNHCHNCIKNIIMNNVPYFKTKQPLLNVAKRFSTECADATSEMTRLFERAERKLELILQPKQSLNIKLKRKRLKTITEATNPNFKNEDLLQSNYYFEKGLRKVYPYSFTFSVNCKDRWLNQNIVDVFASEFAFDNETAVKARIKQNRIKVNGNVITPDYVIKKMDHIEHLVHRHELPVTADDIEILHNTEHFLVVNKPSSVPMHPCGRYGFNSLLFILAKEHGMKYLRACYRLDRLTSGLVIYGKTKRAARQITEDIRFRRVEKEYVCRVEGEFPSGVIDCDKALAFLSKKMGMWKVSENGIHARTTFERLSFNGSTSVVKCRPFTGRTHQIRIHLQYLGYPIINDPLYNGDMWGPLKGKGGDFGRPEQQVIDDITHQISDDRYLNTDTSLEATRNNHLSRTVSTADLLPSTANGSQKTVHEREYSNYDDDQDCSTSNKFFKLETSQKPNFSQLKCVDSSELNENAVQSASYGAEVICDINEMEEDSKPGYNHFLTSYDDKCKHCKVLYNDPAPSSMVMYLHAYRYKGPGWEYETPLPVWAEDNYIDHV